MQHGKDSFWLQLEVCREYQRARCTRSDVECKFAHPPTNVEVGSNGRVTACYDSIKVSRITKLASKRIASCSGPASTHTTRESSIRVTASA